MPATEAPQSSGLGPNAQSSAPLPGLSRYQGKTVTAIDFAGVDRAALEPLPGQLPQQAGQPLDPQKVRDSLRRLYATGLYDRIDLDGTLVEGGVRLTFAGAARSFFGAVTIAGVKSDRLSAQLARSTGIDLGTPYSDDAVNKGKAAILESLETSGFHQAKVAVQPSGNPVNGVRTVTYTVDTGMEARVGEVMSEGTPGLDNKKFRHVSKLKRGSKVTQDTTRTAIKRLRAHYQKENRLEARITQNREQFQPLTDTMDYGFLIDRGPIVTFVVDGAHVSRGKLQSLVPVFQEGSVDQDLLNEGSRHLRDYFQDHGYFDAQIKHSQQPLADGKEQITYTVDKGAVHRVASVRIAGNKYFDSDTLRERLSVTKADFLFRYGRFTEGLMNKDVDAITNLYQANGFRDVKVTPKVADQDKDANRGLMSKISIIRVLYRVEEGTPEQVRQSCLHRRGQGPGDRTAQIGQHPAGTAVLAREPVRRPRNHPQLLLCPKASPTRNSMSVRRLKKMIQK